MASATPFLLARDEKLLTCPYDKSHRVLEARYLLHIRKCRAGYVKRRTEAGLTIEIEVCHFDYLHHVPASKFSKHIEEDCPTAIERGLIKKVVK